MADAVDVGGLKVKQVRKGKYTINSRMGQDRCLWGTDGLPWKESLEQVEQIGLKEEAKRKLLGENAKELFRL